MTQRLSVPAGQLRQRCSTNPVAAFTELTGCSTAMCRSRIVFRAMALL